MTDKDFKAMYPLMIHQFLTVTTSRPTKHTQDIYFDHQDGPFIVTGTGEKILISNIGKVEFTKL